jgi:SAM-dependent methyltransferase
MTNARTPGLALRAKLAIAKARIDAAEQVDAALVGVGSLLGRAGRRAILQVHRHEDVDLPTPFAVGDKVIDVARDLQEYTGLPAGVVEDLLRRRANSFRAEWFLTPEGQRADSWFYLSSAMYLFGNAAHDPTPLMALVEDLAPSPAGRILDFGGGSGNLALALAASGWSVDHLERSALQKDFVSFRGSRYGLSDRLRVLDHWRPLDRDAYEIVLAIDVLEHVENLDELLRSELLPAIRPHGRLVEASPFVRNLSNPMHHEHGNFEEVMTRSGFAVEAEGPADLRVWRR